MSTYLACTTLAVIIWFGNVLYWLVLSGYLLSTLSPMSTYHQTLLQAKPGVLVCTGYLPITYYLPTVFITYSAELLSIYIYILLSCSNLTLPVYIYIPTHYLLSLLLIVLTY